MSRLPTPDGGWSESTEGDLDPDLAEETESSLDDWSEPRRPWFQRAMPAIALGMLAFFLGAMLVQVLFAR